MNELELMKTDPQTLFGYYMQLMQEGVSLTPDQLIKLEYIVNHVNR